MKNKTRANYMNIPKLFSVSIFLFIISCQGQRSDTFSKEETRIIDSIGLQEPPPPNFSLPIYLMNDKDSVCETSINNLFKIYKAGHSSREIDRADFLYKLLNNRANLSSIIPGYEFYCTKTFKLDSSIISIYNHDDLDGIVKKYLESEGMSYKLKLNLPLTENQIHSISYVLFRNRYFKSVDDYHATTTYSKISSFLLK